MRQFFLWSLLCIAISGQTAPVTAQPPKGDTTAISDSVQQDPHAATLSRLEYLISERAQKQQDQVLNDILVGDERDPIEIKNLEAQGRALNAEVEQIEIQISALTTGVSEEEFDLSTTKEIDLQAEIEQLVQPLIIMLRSATENSRRIEHLRRTLSVAANHEKLAQSVLERLEPLVKDANLDSRVGRELGKIQKRWETHKKEAKDLYDSTDQQLQTKMDEQDSPIDTVALFFTGFFTQRGFNLLLGISAFCIVFGLCRLGDRIAAQQRRKRGLPRNFASRLASLIYSILTVVAAAAAMFTAFNLMNDWLLLGLSVILFIAAGWFAVKMLPQVTEHITLYLNLGAVQENERVFFNGIPWHVKKLDFYTELENPVLQGGLFIVPIRELVGLHSRPITPDEPWFPTRQGDWVKMDGVVGQVSVQSPGVVQVIELGGARHTFPAPAFFENAPINLSHGARAEIEFGLSYKHKDIAGSEIPEKLAEYVRQGLLEFIPSDQLITVKVDLLQAGSSSIDYEVEADLTGEAAPLYEDVERAIAKLSVEAANHFNWEIPFPQLVLHQEP